MNTKDFDFDLPEELIAQTPLGTGCLSFADFGPEKKGH